MGVYLRNFGSFQVMLPVDSKSVPDCLAVLVE